MRPRTIAHRVAIVLALMTLGLPGTQADERWLLRGLMDAEFRDADMASAHPRTEGGDTAAGGDLQLWFAADLHSRVQTVVVGRVREGHAYRRDGVESAVEQAYVRTTLGSARRIFLDVGELQTELGNFATRDRSSMNPLIGRPLGSALSHAVGLRLSGAVGRFDFRVSVVDRPPIDERFLPDAGSAPRPAVAFGVSPTRGLRLGTYYTEGSYLARIHRPWLEPGSDWRDFQQRIIGLDVHFSRRYLECNADYRSSRYEVPTLGGAVRGSAGFVEVKYVLRPRWFVALRGSRMYLVNVSAASGTGGTALESRVEALEAGAGFRASRGILVKVAYLDTRSETTIHPEGKALSAQLSYRFDLREMLDRLN